VVLGVRLAPGGVAGFGGRFGPPVVGLAVVRLLVGGVDRASAVGGRLLVVGLVVSVGLVGLGFLGEDSALLGVVEELPSELALGLANRPAEVHVTVVADAGDLDEDGLALVPVERVESPVEFALVEETGHSVADVHEDAELGEAVYCAAVIPSRRQLVGVVAGEFEEDVLLVALADGTVGRSPADDTRTHLIREKYSPGLKLLSKLARRTDSN